MAIVKMKRLSLITLKCDTESTLSILEKLGVVEIEKCEQPGTDISRIPESDLDSRIRQTEKAATELKRYVKSAPKDMPPQNSIHLANAVIDAVAKRQSLLDAVVNLKTSVSAITPYARLDVPLGMKNSKHARFKTGYFPFETELSELKLIFPDAHFEIISKQGGKTYVWAAYTGDINAELIDHGFIEEKLSTDMLPADWIKNQEDKIAVLETQLKQTEKELSQYADRIFELSTLPLMREKEHLEAMSKLGSTSHTTVITGYLPAKNVSDLKNALPDAYIEITEPGDDAPVMFKNNLFAAPVEDITGTYSMPSKDDIDPNPIMAFFYYLFFGMMFSDAGYGLLMVLVCGYLGFIKKKSKMKNSMRMFFFCGISTTFWGLMYGSFFGNAITSVSETFFGTPITLTPIWIDPTAEPLTLLIFSIALGFAQILVGLTIKFYMLARRGRWAEALFDVLSWILTLSGIAFIAAGIVISPLMKIGYILAGIGAITLIVTQGRNNKNLIGKLFGGVLSLYDITSYVSDILSYSRLMALGLATGVIAQVINILGSLGGKSVVGVIMYVLVFLLGHAMNFAINMLGAYVHTNRLQYVEFYSKFYEGGGRRFNPFGKYYKEMKGID